MALGDDHRERSGGSLGGPVTVHYVTSGGTASAGSDYAAAGWHPLPSRPAEPSESFTVLVTTNHPRTKATRRSK